MKEAPPRRHRIQRSEIRPNEDGAKESTGNMIRQDLDSLVKSMNHIRPAAQLAIFLHYGAFLAV